jgi:uncharacterized membrane protein
MRRIRTLSLLAAPLVTMLVFAPMAFAHTEAGEGIYGPTNDKIVTSWMLGLLLFFPLLITVFSILQSRLDKRKYARLAAQKARTTAQEWKGGW